MDGKLWVACGFRPWSKAAWRWGFPPQSKTVSRQGGREVRCYPRESAAVGFDGTTVRFFFGITEGTPGEVSFVELNGAIGSVISGSSSISNSVDLLLPTNPNPSLLDVATKLDQLIQALRR